MVRDFYQSKNSLQHFFFASIMREAQVKLMKNSNWKVLKKSGAKSKRWTIEQLLGGEGDTKSQTCVEKKSSESLSKLANELKQFGFKLLYEFDCCSTSKD